MLLSAELFSSRKILRILPLKTKKNLHADLIADCAFQGIPSTSIKLITDVQNFIDKEIIGRSTELKEILTKLHRR